MIKRDILNGTGHGSDSGGYSSARIRYIAAGVPGVGQEQSDNLKDFVESEYPGAMSYGSAHPSLVGLYVSTTQSTPLGKTPNGPTFQVDVTYARLNMPPKQEDPEDPNEDPEPSFSQIQISGSTIRRQEVGDTDIDGNQVEVAFTPPPVEGKDQDQQTQAAIIPRDVIQDQYTATRRERITFQQLIAKKKKFTNRVNSGPWRIDPSAKPDQWLVDSINFQSSDGGVVYDVTYILIYDNSEHGHRPDVRFIDRSTGLPPKGLIDGVGRKWPQMNHRVDLNELQL